MDTPPKRRFTKDEREVVKKVMADYNSAKMSRNNSCYWDTSSTSTDEEGSKNWILRWDLQDKMAISWAKSPSKDEFESNVKSPMAMGRIDSTMQKLRRLDLQWVIRPEDSDESDDKRKARVIQELLNQLFHEKAYKERLNTWWQDCLTHGSSFIQIYYLKKSRKVKVYKEDIEKMSDEEREKLKNKEKVYEEKTIYDYDDIAIEPVDIREIYVDPSARVLHGTSYEAQYIIRRMLPSLEQFEAMFKNDPDAKNVEKVRPASAYGVDDREFFEPPTDVSDDNYVQLLQYYNKAEDKYVVIANDIVIKDMPLPYEHKQLPFEKIDASKVLNQFYGSGIPDKVAQIQAEVEILKNLTTDRLHITANPMLKVKSSIYGEFSKAYREAEPGMMFPVNNIDDVSPLEYPTMNFDLFRALEILERDAVLATQIDPIQMGVNQKYVSATTSMLTKEQMDSYIGSLIDLWKESLTNMAYQIVSLMAQFYTKPRFDEANEKAKNRKVKLEGIEINPETMEVVQKNSKEYSFLEVKPEYFEVNGDWDITIAPESVEVKSKAIEMQKAQANIAQMAPFMVDPSNKKAVSMHPAPWIDGPKLLQHYIEVNDMPEDILAKLSEDEDISVKRAELQGKSMVKGENVPGIPGESDVHKQVHVQQLHVINEQARALREAFGEISPEMMPYIQEIPQMQELMGLERMATIFAQHIVEDNLPMGSEEPEVGQVMQQSQPQQPLQVPMPPGLTPAGSSQPPAPAGGNQQSGMGPQLPQQGRPTAFEQQQ